MLRECAPQCDGQLPIVRHVENQREARAIIVIDSGLAAGRRVQIENDTQARCPAPSNQPVEQTPAGSFEPVGAAIAWFDE